MLGIVGQSPLTPHTHTHTLGVLSSCIAKGSFCLAMVLSSCKGQLQQNFILAKYWLQICSSTHY